MRVPKFFYILLRSQRATLNTNICKQTVKENFFYFVSAEMRNYIVYTKTRNSLG